MIIYTQNNIIFEDEFGDIINIPNSHRNFEKIKNALQSNDFERAKTLSDVESTVEKFISKYNKDGIVLKNDSLYYNNKKITGYIVDKVLGLHENGLEYKPVMNFLNNVIKNPSWASNEELFLFLEHANLPITEDGHFIAYKVVNKDYFDIYSGKFDNSVGNIVTMDRQDVNPNRNKVCSNGLHFCDRDYIQYYSSDNEDKIILIKINPADVVSIPSDYNNMKGRCCRYEVIKDITEEYRNSVDNIKNEDLYTGENHSLVNMLFELLNTKTKTELAHLIGTSRRTLGRWLTGELYPNDEYCEKIKNISYDG